MDTSMTDALLRVLALASGMAAGAAIGLGVAVAVTPEAASKQQTPLLVLQGGGEMAAQPHQAARIRDRS